LYVIIIEFNFNTSSISHYSDLLIDEVPTTVVLTQNLP